MQNIHNKSSLRSNRTNDGEWNDGMMDTFIAYAYPLSLLLKLHHIYHKKITCPTKKTVPFQEKNITSRGFEGVLYLTSANTSTSSETFIGNFEAWKSHFPIYIFPATNQKA
jgi:hypothetical protein